MAELRINRSCTIDESELSWRFTTSGGPGGQHANRAATRAEVTFDIDASQSLSDEQRRRLRDRFGSVVAVAADEERSQTRNREIARNRLRERLAQALKPTRARRPTRPTRASKQRRLDAKRRRGHLKRQRRSPDE